MNTEDRVEVYTGTIVLDSKRFTPEQQRERIFQMMELAGIEVGDPSDLEIGYEGVTDNQGLSETQKTKFVVYRKVKKNHLEVLREDDVNDILQELKELREKLEKTQNGEDRAELIDKIAKRTEKLEKTVGDSRKMDAMMKEELNSLENQIISLQTELKRAALDYEASYNRLQIVIEEQKARLEHSGLLSEEELDKLRESYAEKKLEENEKSIVIKKKIEEQKKLLTSLKKRRNKIKRDVETAEALGLTVDELHDITSTLNKKEILKSIFEKKGLADIIWKKASERSKEEKQVLKEARDEIIKEIGALKVAEEMSTLDAIQILYDVSPEYKVGSDPTSILIRERQLGNIRKNASKIPEKIVREEKPEKEQDYVPLEKPEDLKQVEEGMHSVAVEEEKRKEAIERITFFKDIKHDGQLYARDYTMRRFHQEIPEIEMKIEGASVYPIRPEVAERIMNSANNGYAPYQINIQEIELEDVLPKEKEVPVEEKKEEPKEEKKVEEPEEEKKVEEPPKEDSSQPDDDLDNRKDMIERIIFYKDLDQNGQFYSKKYTMTRFELPMEDELRIDGVLCYPINSASAEKIMKGANTGTAPYFVEVREFHSGKKLPPKEEEKTPPKEEEKAPPKESEEIVFYRNVDNTDMIYANAYVLLRYGINPHGKLIRINEINSYQITEEEHQKICDLARKKENGDVSIRYEGIRINKKEVKKPVEEKKPSSVQEILDKVTNNLFQKPQGSRGYQPTNLQASKKFEKELQSGEWVYNIIHYVPSIGKATTAFLEKISEKLLSSGRINEGLREIERRMQNDLTEEEMDTLFREYRSSDSLKTQYQNPVNRVVLDKLKNYGLERIHKIHRMISKNSLELYSLLGQMKALEEQIASAKLGEEERYAFHTMRKQLIVQAADVIQKIQEGRKAAGVILKSGIPGIEQEYQEDQYPLLAFGNKSLAGFDSELQQRYFDYQKEYQDALASNDAEGIVMGFMGIESCKYENTDVARSLVGRRSIGSKYFTSYAKENGYPDDSFARDLFASIALPKAVVYARYDGAKCREINYSLEDVIERFGKKNLAPKRVVDEVAVVARSSYDTLARALDDVIPKLDPTLYPISEIRAAINSIANRPSALGDMKQDLPEMKAIESLPKDARDILLNAIASCAYSVQVAGIMDSKYGNKNDINEMLKEGQVVENSQDKVL